jgi:hypothetical protein
MATLAAVSLCVLVAGQAGHSSAATTEWNPTPAEISTVLGQAQVEAWSTSVQADGTSSQAPTQVISAMRGARPAATDNISTPAAWPASVHNVSTVATTRAAAQNLLDGATTQSQQQVIVVRLHGNFRVEVTGPPGSNPYATGTTMTVVVDPNTGSTLDFGLTSESTGTPMPAAASVVLP